MRRQAFVVGLMAVIGCRNEPPVAVDCDLAMSAVWVRWPHAGVDLIDLGSGKLSVELGSLCHDPMDLVFDIHGSEESLANVQLDVRWVDEGLGLLEFDLPVQPEEEGSQGACQAGGTQVTIWTRDQWGTRQLHDSLWFPGQADLDAVEALQVELSEGGDQER